MEKVFVSWVPQDERIALMKTDLYRPALHIAANSELRVESFTNVQGGHRVGFAYNGHRVMWVTQFGSDFTTSIVSSSVSIHGAEPAVKTTKPMYMAKALLKKDSKALRSLSYEIETATEYSRRFVEAHVRLTYRQLTGDRKMSITYRDLLGSKALAALVQVFFNERNAIDVPQDVRESLENVRTERDRRQANVDEVNQQMVDMFGVRKWMVNYMPGYGYTVRQLDIAHSWVHILEGGTRTPNGIVDTQPMQMFRSLEDMPDGMRESILPNLTYAKMHMQGRESRLSFDAEPHDLVPDVESDVVVSVDTGVCYTKFGDTRSVMLNVG